MKKIMNKIPLLLPFLFILLGTILFMLSFPNFLIENGISGLSAIALVPLFIALSLFQSRKYAVLLGAFFGVASTCLAYFWLSQFQGYSLWTLGSVSIGYMAEYAIVFFVLHRVIHSLSHKTQSLALAIIWTGYEYLKSIGFLGFPWTLLAQSFHNVLPFIQLARITGVWGVSFIVAFCNGLIYITITQNIRKNNFVNNKKHEVKISHQWLIFTGCIAMIMTYGMISMNSWKKRTIKESIPMLLVQQNVDSWEFTDINRKIENLEKIIQKTESEIKKAEIKPKLIVWSETSLSIPYQPNMNADWDNIYENYPQSLPFKQFLKKYDTPLLSGSIRFDEENTMLAYNSATLIKANGDVADNYAKYQLVPFAERIPFFQFKFVRSFINNIIGLGGTWSRGKSVEPITWNNYNSQGDSLLMGTPICFEDSFPYVTRTMKKKGADILINLTNVSWSNSRSAQMQQLAAAKFRSIETGLPLVRSTNTGVTTLVYPWGEIIQPLPMFTEGALMINVPIYEKTNTLFILLGDFFGYVNGILTLGIIVYLRKRNKQK